MYGTRAQPDGNPTVNVYRSVSPSLSAPQMVLDLFSNLNRRFDVEMRIVIETVLPIGAHQVMMLGAET
jgi:hypothetical protein